MPSDAESAFQPLENWRDLRTQLLWAYDGSVAEVNRDMEYNGVSIPAWLIRKGSATLRLGSEVEHFSSGVWIFPKEKAGWQQFSMDAELLSVRFQAEWPTGQPLFDRSRTIMIPEAQAPALTRIGERLSRLIAKRFPGAGALLPQRHGSPEEYFEIERLLFGWLLAYTSAMKKAGLFPHTIGKLDERIRQALHHMEIRPLSKPLREAELTALTGLSRSQLNRLFVDNLGITPADYWERKRIQMARMAIVEGGQSIKSIAFDLGFSSLPHFSNWVRKKLGVSPRELRESRSREG